MKNTDMSERNLLPDEVDVYLDIFGATMLNWIRSHVYRIDIITGDKSQLEEDDEAHVVAAGANNSRQRHEQPSGTHPQHWIVRLEDQDTRLSPR
jgi:hypothetical protein